MPTKTLKYLSFTLFFILLGLTNCVPRKSECPAFYAYGPGEGVYSAQDGVKEGGKMSDEEIRQQNKRMLDEQGTFIRVKRNKKTGLVATSRRVKRVKSGKAYTDKGYKFQPGNPIGVDIYRRPAKKED